MGSKFIGVDLFAGAGGMSLGASTAGVDVRLAVEANRHAAATYARNHRDTTVLSKDVRKLQPSDLPRWRCKETILFGGPPCQGFSTSNQRTRSTRNPTNWLFREYLRVVEMWQPAWVVFENVTGIRETEGGLFLRSVQEGLDSRGYTVSVWVLNAADFGAPQRRLRLFAIGSRNGATIEAPQPTRKTPVKVWSAIGDLPRLKNGASIDRLPYKAAPSSQYARGMRGRLRSCCNHLVTDSARHIVGRYRHVRPGGNWEDIPLRLMKNYANRERCHTGIYRRLRRNEVSVVIANFRKNMLIHPTQDRGLSVREAARLQSFPDQYVFEGSIGFQQQQVGNAVPPLLAEAVFKAITES